jgi:hypothetical protein
VAARRSYPCANSNLRRSSMVESSQNQAEVQNRWSCGLGHDRRLSMPCYSRAFLGHRSWITIRRPETWECSKLCVQTHLEGVPRRKALACFHPLCMQHQLPDSERLLVIKSLCLVGGGRYECANRSRTNPFKNSCRFGKGFLLVFAQIIQYCNFLVCCCIPPAGLLLLPTDVRQAGPSPKK